MIPIYVKFFQDKSKDFWLSLPIRTHDGNLSLRKPEQLVLHSLINWAKPKTSIEFGYNMGHSAILILDASDENSKLYSFDTKKTNGDLLSGSYNNFTFVHGDSVTEFETLNIDDIDFVLIDSLHSYDQVTKEINCVFPKLKIGGILYFDDTNSSKVFNAILESKYYQDMEEITNWLSGNHLLTPFIEINDKFFREKVIRIYKKIK